jgi:hypothetical protein
MSNKPSRNWPIAFPYPHFMGFAPIDVWLRLLFRLRVSIPPRYWLRLGLALLLSLMVTVVTLPERILTALWLRLWRSRPTLPGPVVILGYYRSGTTLLQYLLACDPNLYSPNWAQAFVPQGYCLTWFLLRWVVLPFFPRTRPQDNVGFGPLVPAEDDFALNNWALASTLPGRVIVPHEHRFYDRFHDLKTLTAEERECWRRCQRDLVRKLATLAGPRRVLLKTPAHTARIPELLHLFRDTTGIKFVYISRHPHKVFRSNVAMLRQLVEFCGVQPPLPEEELENYLLREYVATEEEYQRTRTLIPAGDLAEVRLQDLQADPLGAIRCVYRQLGLECSPVMERRMIAYLNANQDYQPNIHPPWTPAQKEKVLPALQPLVKWGQHESPAPARVELPRPDAVGRRRQLARALSLGPVIAVLSALTWLGLAFWVGGHSAGFAWACGIAIGLAVLRGAANHGSTALGASAAALAALTCAAVSLLAPVLLPDTLSEMPFIPLLTAFWSLMGMLSAYRIGSQRF